MKAIEGRRYQMLVRVREFGETHRDLFQESTRGRQAFETVATAVTQLSKHAVSKLSTTGEGRRAKTVAREALLGRLEAITRTARAFGDVASLDCFHLPPKLSDHMVLMTARAFLPDAESFAHQFIALGMAPTFLADLIERVDGFEQAIHAWEAGRTGQAVARAGMAAAFSEGFAAVRTLDVVVTNVLHGDLVALAGWECDRRIGYPPRKRQPSRGSSATPIVRLGRTA